MKNLIKLFSAVTILLFSATINAAPIEKMEDGYRFIDNPSKAINFWVNAKVENLSYHKVVGIRWTDNNWRTTNESLLQYKRTLPGNHELWDLELTYNKWPKHGFGIYAEIKYVLFYKANGETYWDNNNDQNYKMTIRWVDEDALRITREDNEKSSIVNRIHGDVLGEVVSYLNPTDLLHLSASCKSIRHEMEVHRNPLVKETVAEARRDAALANRAASTNGHYLAAGGTQTCAIKENGYLKCWGAVDFDDGNFVGTTSSSSIPWGLGKVGLVAVGDVFTCIVKATDRNVRCWRNGGVWFSDSDVHKVPRGLGRVKIVSAGARHACAITENKMVRCWGSYAPAQALPQDLNKVRSLTAGGYHTCATKVDGNVVCWGNDDHGQVSVPNDLGPVSALAAGGSHTCAIIANGGVRCWGNNNNHETEVPGNLGQVRALAAGDGHTCAIKENRTVQCWGWNYDHQIEVPGYLGEVMSLTAGAGHNCAVRIDGNTICWGRNDYRQATPPEDLGPILEKMSIPAEVQAPLCSIM